MNDTTINHSRRTILKAATIAGIGGATLSLPARAQAPAQHHFDESYDVVIVGSGFGGLAAALQARELGMSVLVVEKMPTFGGNSCLNGSGLAVAGLAEQAKLGIEDSAELYKQDLLKAGRGLGIPELAHAIAYGSKEAYEWVVSHGVKFIDGVYLYGGHSVPRVKLGHRSTGADITIPLREKGEQLGAQFRSRCAMEEILMDNGSAVGIRVLDRHEWQRPGSGVEKRIQAKKGLIIATGGYAADVQFRLLQDPRLDASVGHTNQPGASAQGLKEMLRVGGVGRHLSYIQLGPWCSPDEPGYGNSPDYSPYAGYTHGIAVDVNTGERFMNETGDRTDRANAIIEILKGTPDAYPVLFCDETGHNDPGITPTRRRRIVKSGAVKAFDTLEALAEHYGIPVKPFLAQVERYNAAVLAGDDSEFGKYITNLKPIGKAPFYAQRLSNRIHYTMGGAAIDQNASVLAMADGKPIPGLYAVGEVSSGGHGASRLGGVGTTDPLVMGRIAAKHIASLG
ncbi:flavocytochrome c [Ferrimonas senticii]|uniref:flavocytochrome c n=1 Tax=Ferrimonas senticii TaxID=394566 RepID=UPI00054F0147|nr:flavocytochrome c [Ferrimonas senticii]